MDSIRDTFVLQVSFNPQMMGINCDTKITNHHINNELIVKFSHLDHRVIPDPKLG